MAYPYQMNLGISRSQAGSLPPITYYASGTPVDLTSASALMTFTNVSTGSTDLTLTLGNGITMTANGLIQVTLTAPQAAQLAADQYEYALQVDMG